MLKLDQIETVYAAAKEYYVNPRVSTRELHKKCSHYKNRNSTTRLLNNARKERVMIGPKIWCNIGYEVEILKNLEDPLLLLDQETENPEVTYMNALIGTVSTVCFKRGDRVVQYAEAIFPTYPAKKTINDIQLDKKGKLPNDAYPEKWDELDWNVFKAMRDPFTSYVTAGGRLGVSWHTVKNRFEKIIKDCKTWIVFLPMGYTFYKQVYLLFETDYEVNFINELQKLDRTSIIYKFNDKILLHLFLDELLDVQIFYKLKRKRMIHSLYVSVPIGWYSPQW